MLQKATNILSPFCRLKIHIKEKQQIGKYLLQILIIIDLLTSYKLILKIWKYK